MERFKPAPATVFRRKMVNQNLKAIRYGIFIEALQWAQ
jgi:hypothetical protein